MLTRALHSQNTNLIDRASAEQDCDKSNDPQLTGPKGFVNTNFPLQDTGLLLVSRVCPRWARECCFDLIDNVTANKLP